MAIEETGVNVNFREQGAEQIAARVAALRAQLDSLQEALQSNLAQASATFASALRSNIAKVEDDLKRLTSTTIQQYATMEDFNIRAIAAMRGQAEAIRGVARALDERDRILRAGAAGVRYGMVEPAALVMAPPVAAGAARRQIEAELAGVFAGAEFRTGEQIAREAVSSLRTSLQGAGAPARGLAGEMRGIGAASSVAAKETGHAMAIFDGIAAGRHRQVVASIGSAMRDAGLSARWLATGVGGLVAVMAAAEIERGVVRMGELAEKTQSAAAAAGVATSQYSLLQRTLQLVSGDSNTLATALGMIQDQMQRAVSDPFSRERGGFGALGFSREDLERGDTISMLEELRKKFEELGPAASEAFRMALGRRAYQQLAPILRLTSSEFENLKQRAKETGAVIGDDTAAQLAKASRATHELGEAWDGLMTELAKSEGQSAVISFLTTATEKLKDFIAAAREPVQLAPEIWTPFGMVRPPGTPAPPAAEAPIPPPEIQQQLELIRRLEGSAATAVSPAGAIGTYQIMPATARAYGFDPSRLMDSAYNAQAATAILSDLNRRFQGNMTDILVAYNAGIGRAEEFIRRGRDIATLPGETQRYIAHAQQILPGVLAMTPAGAPGAPAAGVPGYDPAGQRRQFELDLRNVREKTRMQDAEYDRQIASARHNTEEVNRLETEKANFAKSQAEAEGKLREEYAQRAIAGKNEEAAAFFRAGNETAVRAVEADTQRIRAQERGDDEAYRRFAEARRNEIADAQSAAQQIVSSTTATTAQKIAAERNAAQTIQGIYNNWLGQITSTYHQDQQEFLRVQREKTQAAREATRQIGQAERQEQRESLRLLERNMQLRREESQVRIRAMELQMRETGGGGLFGGGVTLFQAQQQAARQSLADIQELANQQVATVQKTVADVQEAETKIREIRVKEAQDELQIISKIQDEWKKLTAPVTQFFNQLGSAIESGVGNVLKALISPQVEIIHAGLTTIRQTHRGQQVAAAIGQMLLSAIQDGAKMVLGAAANAIGNMLLQGVAGSTVSEKLSTLVMSWFTQQAPSLTGAAGLTAAGTTLTTAGGGLNAAAAALSASAASLAAGGAAGGVAGIFGKAAPLAIGAAILSRGGIIPSAQGGMVVGGLGGTLALLHPREMVLPAHISDTVQAMAGMGGGGRAPGGGTINYNPVINTGSTSLSRSDFASMLSGHTTDIMGRVKSMYRGGWRP